MIKIYHRTIKDAELNICSEFKVGSWVNAYDLKESEIDKLVGMLKVEKSLIADALDVHEVPRLEVEEGITYVFTRVPEKDGGEITTLPFLIVMGNDFLLTVCKENCGFLHDFIEGKKAVYTTQKIKFFLELFSAITHKYNIFLNDINKRLRGMRVRLERIGNKDIIQFVDLEKILNDFLSALIPTNSLLQKLLDGKHIKLYEDDHDLVEDLFLATGQLVEISKSSLRHAVNIRTAYSNIMTHDLNRVMKILTALTILLTVPTMIFSFFGMNVALPFSGSLNIIILTLVISLTLLIVFIKNRWL